MIGQPHRLLICQYQLLNAPKTQRTSMRILKETLIKTSKDVAVESFVIAATNDSISSCSTTTWQVLEFRLWLGSHDDYAAASLRGTAGPYNCKPTASLSDLNTLLTDFRVDGGWDAGRGLGQVGPGGGESARPFEDRCWVERGEAARAVGPL
eukprot:3235972-Pleurochrysis_carterae.AAC.1